MTKLKKGEYKCKTCKGKGTVLAEDDPNTLIWIKGTRVPCPTCNGKQTVDWVKNAIGSPLKKKGTTIPF